MTESRSMMFILVLGVLLLLGATVWVVLDRPVTRDVASSDRLSAALVSASAVALAAGLVYGFHGLL